MENNKVLEFKSKLIEKGLDVSEFEEYLRLIEDSLKGRKYGLVWEDSVEEVEEELKYKTPTLKEEESLRINKGEEYTNNLLIEGDNLESLTYLKNAGKKVEVIYIDPPYNSLHADGSFVYKDRRLNKEDSYRHSSWISFMEKRLKIARELMTEDGVMFISIDDREQANLRLLCDIIFGEGNVEVMIWEKVGDGGAGAGKMKMINRYRVEHEYILVCYKDKSRVRFGKYLELPNFKNKYTNPDNDYRGNFKGGNMSKTEEKSNPKGVNYYTIETPGGKKYTRQWHFSKEVYDEYDKDGRIYYGKTGTSIPRIKIFINEPRLVYPSSILKSKGSATMGSSDLKNILGVRKFDNPKPIKLLKHLMGIATESKNVTILDFFAGSGSLGHAVLELNKEDGGNRDFILCTNNENNICRDVTYERLNKVINGYTTPKGKEVEGIPSNLKYYKTELVDKEEGRK